MSRAARPYIVSELDTIRSRIASAVSFGKLVLLATVGLLKSGPAGQPSCPARSLAVGSAGHRGLAGGKHRRRPTVRPVPRPTSRPRPSWPHPCRSQTARPVPETGEQTEHAVTATAVAKPDKPSAEHLMREHFTRDQARGCTPTGAELDRVAGTNNYGRTVLRRWRGKAGSHRLGIVFGMLSVSRVLGTVMSRS